MKIQKKSFLLPPPSSPEWGRSNGGNLWHFPSRNAFRYPSSPSYYVQSAKIYLLNVQNLSFVRYLTKISMFVTFVLKEPLPPLPNVFLQVSWAQHLVWGLVLFLWGHLIVRLNCELVPFFKLWSDSIRIRTLWTEKRWKSEPIFSNEEVYMFKFLKFLSWKHFCQTSLRLVLSEVKTLIQWTILCWKNTALQGL